MMGQQQQMGNNQAMMMQQQMMAGANMGFGAQQYQRKGNMPIPGLSGMNLFGGEKKPKREYDNSVCLYVGNLTPTTFDNDLFKFFKNKGYKLRNAQVMLDMSTKKSKQYGYLNFYTQEEALKCFQEQNNAILNGKQIVLNQKKNKDFDSAANVLLKNLSKEITQNDLHNMCKSFGKIISCKLEVSADGSSRGYGYVQFDNKENAEKAIGELNKSTHHGKEILAIVHSKKNDREESGEHFTNLFVKNIPTNFTDDQLKKIFAEFGEITSCKVKGEGSDVGFVMFKTHDQAQAAIDGLNQKTEVNGKTLFVSKFISQGENKQQSSNPPISQSMKETFKSNIFVRFIPKEITEDQFQKEMVKAGKILSLKLRDNEQTVNGVTFVSYKVGYVCYEDVRQAQKCIQMFDASNAFGYGQKPLKVDFWQSKYDLQHENEEKNINQVKKFIHYIQ